MMIQASEDLPVVESAAAPAVGVLMIEDDPTFARLVQGVLQRHGYQVTTVNNPVKALEVYTRHQEEIQLVLLDYFMPTLDGAKTLEWLRRMNPEIRVILCSGTEELRLRQLMVQLPLDGFIRKPFRALDAVATIRDVMAKPTRQV